ncbi:unnamed protein product [Diamesa hyperborea]
MSLVLCHQTDDNNNNNSLNNNGQNENPEGDVGDVTIYRLCAPIASLDCMEEFSGNTGHDMRRSVSSGSKNSLRNNSSTPGLRYKNLGKSGLRVSNVGLATWSVFANGISEEQAESIIRLAYESGINLFDLSDLYSGPRAEIELGNILKKTNWKRMTYVVNVKIYWSIKSEERGLSRKHIIENVQASLKRLQLDYIDVIIIHKCDSMCPMEEMVRAMNYCVEKGWALYWGTSKWTPTEIMEAYSNCREFNCVTPIVEQSEYHMFHRDRAELYLPEMYNKIGVGLMAWGPLGVSLSENSERIFFSKTSLRSKTQNSSWTEDEMTKEDRVEEAKRHVERIRSLNMLAEKLGCTLIQLSIAWSLKHEPVHCLLIGAKTTEELHQNLQALQLVPRLSVPVMLEIERILANKPVRPPMISTLQMRGLVSHVRTLYSIANDKPNYIDYGNNTDLHVASKVTPLHLSASNIKTISQPGPSSSEPTRKNSNILSLKSLSLSLRLLKRGKQTNSSDTSDGGEETSHRKVRQRTYFKNQRIYARRSSMSDLGENQPQQQQQKTLQQSVTSHTSNSTVNVSKQQVVTKHHYKPVEPPKQKPSTTELLKKARERNSTESAVKRAAVPRRTSTAY